VRAILWSSTEICLIPSGGLIFAEAWQTLQFRAASAPIRSLTKRFWHKGCFACRFCWTRLPTARAAERPARSSRTKMILNDEAQIEWRHFICNRSDIDS
jgi:hypothetical protein